MVNTGDKVRHKTDEKYNGLLMTVKDIDEGKVLCEYFDYSSKEIRNEWFDEDKIEVSIQAEGGFL